MEEDTARHMENIYRDADESDIPWNRTEPPELLVSLVDSGKINPCRALDIGCGTGNYSVWLARRGFEVSGVDVSRSAVEIAGKKAQENGLEINFIAADMRGGVDSLGDGYRFALEWMIMHHILPDGREHYLKNLSGLLDKDAKVLSVSFSAEDPNFGEPPRGNWRKSPMGPRVYLSYMDELVDFFSPLFEIIENEVSEIPGKFGSHMVNYLFMKKM